MIRISFITLFAAIGFISLAFTAILFIPSGLKPRMNKEFFQPKANAEVDTLIHNSAITPVQEPAIRAFVKRTYMMIGVSIMFAIGTASGAIGLFFLLLSYCLYLSHRIATAVRAQQDAAANP